MPPWSQDGTLPKLDFEKAIEAYTIHRKKRSGHHVAPHLIFYSDHWNHR